MSHNRHTKQQRRLLSWVLALGVVAVAMVGILYYLGDPAVHKLALKVGIPAYGPAALPGSAWTWTRSEFSNGSAIYAPGGDAFALSFGVDGRLTSTTDCNSVFGEFSAAGTSLRIGPLASTKIYCGPATLEGEYAAQLSRARSYSVTGSELRIELEEGSGAMFFGKRR